MPNITSYSSLKYYNYLAIRTHHYPFGSPINARSVNAGTTYAYGFNGKRKDNEITVDGGDIDYGARNLDTRLGIWWSVDPDYNKYPYSSPYVAFGNCPIYFKDNGGRSLEPGGDIKKALMDIQSLVPKEYRSFIKIDDEGKIKFEGYDLLPDKVKGYEGVSLVNDLISSPNKYKIIVGENAIVTASDGRVGTEENKLTEDYRSTIDNYSNTPYWPDNPDAGYGPEPGFDGVVRINDGEYTSLSFIDGSVVKVPRSNVVFHELKENYFRTEKTLPKIEGKSYAKNGGMYYSSSFKECNENDDCTGGAHEASGSLGKKFAKELKQSSTGSDGQPQGLKFKANAVTK